MKSAAAEFSSAPTAGGAAAVEPLPLVRLQRSAGAGRVSFKIRDGRTVLEDVYQSGCCKIRFPRTEPGTCPQAILINTAGGLTDADVLNVDARWQPDTRAIVTSQAAERVYRSRGECATVANRLSVCGGATALWLPQETILFDGGKLSRRLDADIAREGRLLACESTVFGRHAMGEIMSHGLIHDAWRVRYDGRLVFADALRIEGDIDSKLQRPAVMGGATAAANILYVDADLETNPDSIVGPLRKLLADLETPAGCSVIGPVLVARILGATGADMRRDLMAVLRLLMRRIDAARERDTRVDVKKPETVAGLPRVWDC